MSVPCVYENILFPGERLGQINCVIITFYLCLFLYFNYSYWWGSVSLQICFFFQLCFLIYYFSWYIYHLLPYVFWVYIIWDIYVHIHCISWYIIYFTNRWHLYFPLLIFDVFNCYFFDITIFIRVFFFLVNLFLSSLSIYFCF